MVDWLHNLGYTILHKEGIALSNYETVMHLKLTQAKFDRES